MQLLIHFLGGENSLIVHLEFKVRSRYLSGLEENKAALAAEWPKAAPN
jgi:hypothetical protein